MEIVIESDPYRPGSTSPAYLRSPNQQQPPTLVSSNNAFYYATLPRAGSGLRLSAHQPDMPDGAPMTTAMRRVDKSGLLEMAELEPPTRQAAARLLSGPEGLAGALSRRLERPGLLEAVPEVPDQCHRTGLASEELLAAAATARSMVERQQHLMGAGTDAVEAALLRRRSFAPLDSQDSTSTSVSTETEASARSAPRVKFAADDVLLSAAPSPPPPDELREPRRTSVVDCLGRLSPRLRERMTPVSLSSIPDVIEAHGTTTTESGGAGTATTMTTSSRGTRVNGEGPEGERAEAEGCEHTAIESVEEARVSYKGAGANGKIGHNDNIQAVHVIILSEQL